MKVRETNWRETFSEEQCENVLNDTLEHLVESKNVGLINIVKEARLVRSTESAKKTLSWLLANIIPPELYV